MTDIPSQEAFEAGPPNRPTWPALRRTMTGHCPNCSEGKLYTGYLNLAKSCECCGEDLSHARAEDGPAYLTILVVAKILGTLMLYVFEQYQPGPWSIAIGFSLAAIALSLVLLPLFKGMIVGIQWAKRMHGF